MASLAASFALSSIVSAPKQIVGEYTGLRACMSTRPRAFAAPRLRTSFRNRRQISCLAAKPETLATVQKVIATQLSVDPSTVTPNSKFSDLGADSLDTVEIMMSLEESFSVSLGEEGAENVSTVQDAADMIEGVISKTPA